jgi:hypothetical protein
MRLYKMYVQGVYSIRVVPDKSPIEVSEAKEDLDIPIGLRLRPFLNSFYAGRVYYNTLRGNNKAQELNVLSIKDIF